MPEGTPGTYKRNGSSNLWLGGSSTYVIAQVPPRAAVMTICTSALSQALVPSSIEVHGNVPTTSSTIICTSRTFTTPSWLRSHESGATPGDGGEYWSSTKFFLS